MASATGKVIVTGAAGFIGSHLAERLVSAGHSVLGVDCFTDYYPRAVKEANLASLMQAPNFRFIDGDIIDLDWARLLDDTEYLFHQAAQAGVRGSWGEHFSTYVRNNVVATQRLLEAVTEARALRGFIFASSSSVYGDAESYPTSEDTGLLPISPYGVTKLTCEHLCRVYYRNFGIPVVMLRYFVTYGPRQRPEMAFHRFIRAILTGKEISVYGDGEQTRDFTYVSDTVEANLLAMNSGLAGQVYNIGGGSRITVNQAIHLLESITGKRALVRREDTSHVRRYLQSETNAALRTGGRNRGRSEETGGVANAAPRNSRRLRRDAVAAAQ
jgi:nucleoside-diphosphate-sugar epimerase